LQAKGHRRIAAVGSDESKMIFQNFFDGYRMAMTGKNLYLSSYVKRVSEQTPQEYDQLVAELMDRAEPPTLIMTFNYRYVGGLIDALERRGLKVPQDISVVMTNVMTNSEETEYQGKQITGFISPRKQELGEIAANSLIDIIENKVNEPVQVNVELTYCPGDTFIELNQ
jgi:LacI family transcriptional regulator, galactose operon repressor